MNPCNFKLRYVVHQGSSTWRNLRAKQFPSPYHRDTRIEPRGRLPVQQGKHQRTNGSQSASVRRDDINGGSSALAACMSYGSAPGTGGTSLLACFDARPAAIQLLISDYGSFDLIPPNPVAAMAPVLFLAGGPRLAPFEASSHRSSCHLRAAVFN